VIIVRVLISPNDVLLFRESKSFTAGEHHLARSVLPLPQTVAGAIRNRILVNNPNAKEFIGYGRDEPTFEILGCFLFKGQEFFSTPYDVVEAKGVEGNFLVKPITLHNYTVFTGKYIHFKSVGGFVSYDTLVKYLKGDLKENVEIIEENFLVKREIRVGIKLKDTKTTEERYFYKAEFLRLNSQLSVWLGEDVKEYLGERGIMKIGGEGRFAYFEVEDVNPLGKLEDAWDEIKSEIEESRRFKLYLATPLLVENGGRYSWNVKPLLEGCLGLKVKIHPLIGKPLVFSGWDYVRNKPKPNRYAIPQGSVYFVEFEGEFNHDKPYLKLGELKRLGFGLCFLGVW
jgi:CRISPR-associated protein Cmr3